MGEARMSETRSGGRSLLVEGVVIVASILLAFAIDAAWDARNDRIEARSVLADLEAEFRESLGLIDRIISIRESRNTQAMRLLEGPAAFPDDDALSRALVQVFLGATSVNIPTGAYSLYVSGGSATRVESDELRTLLASWPGILEENAEEEATEVQMTWRQMTPFLRSRVDLGPIYSAHPAADEVFGTFPPPRVSFGIDPRSLLDDPEFLNYTVARLALNRVLLREVRALRSAAREILDLLGQELGR